MEPASQTGPKVQADEQDDVAPAVDASSVLLLRDAAGVGDGVEVLLLRRHVKSKAFAGAYVFPGGTVDATDHRLPQSCWQSDHLSRWRQRLGATDEESALGFLVAAVRETFEEAGVLLASRLDGTPLSGEELSTETFLDARQRMVSRSQVWDWSAWLMKQGLSLDLDALEMWSWWVTPVNRPHRFDTRFFAAAMPIGQCATPCQAETTAMRWIAPGDAIDDHRSERVHMIRPTVQNLLELGRFSRADEALEAARNGEIDCRRVQPPAVP